MIWNITDVVCLQLWMMKGQIEEQNNNKELAREAYNQGVSYIFKLVIKLCLTYNQGMSCIYLISMIKRSLSKLCFPNNQGICYGSITIKKLVYL
jgi:hypothetical protein